MSTDPVKFEVGGVWETPDFEIRFDNKCSSLTHECPCPHAYDFSIRTGKTHAGREWTDRQWFVPRALVAFNEGGFCSTGICVDCALAAIKSLDG